MLGSLATQLRIGFQNFAAERRLNSSGDALEYQKLANTILKLNIKNYLKKEQIIMVSQQILPFKQIKFNVLDDLETRIDFLITQAIGPLTKSKQKENKKLLNSSKDFDVEDNPDFTTQNQEKSKESENLVEIPIEEKVVGDENINLKEIIFDNKLVKYISTALNIELEKVFIQEAIAYYMSNINTYSQNLSQIHTEEVILSERLSSEPISLLNSRGIFQIVPCLHSFLGRIVHTSLHINTLNKGESLVIPINELEDSISILNKGLKDYIENVKNEAMKDSKEKRIIKETEALNLKKELYIIKDELNLLKENKEKIIESRVSEKCSNLIFEIDILKKRLKYESEEADFRMRELSDKIKKEYNDKILNNEILNKKMQNRFSEYKEGMSLEIRKYIDSEKHSTMRMIKEKKNQIFATQIDSSLIIKGDPFEIQMEEADHELVSKLHFLLKKLRIFYFLKDITIKEKYEKKIEELKQLISGNQNLLSKITELQSNEENLKQVITQSKKEIAVMEQQNNLLRKHLQNDLKEKVKLMKLNNQTRNEIVDLEGKYHDVLQRKAIFVPGGISNHSISRPQTAGRIKEHIDGLTKSFIGEFRDVNFVSSDSNFTKVIDKFSPSYGGEKSDKISTFQQIAPNNTGPIKLNTMSTTSLHQSQTRALSSSNRSLNKNGIKSAKNFISRNLTNKRP